MKLKRKILREFFDVSPDCLIELFGRHAIDLRQIGVQNHALAANEADQAFDKIGRWGSHFILTQSRKGAKRLFFKAIYHSEDAVLDHGCTKIDEQAEAFIHQSEVGQQLFFVHLGNFFDGFEFNQDTVSPRFSRSRAKTTS